MSVTRDRKIVHCDVAVIGAGLAGLCAALQAQESGARVCVLEKSDEAHTGGNTQLAGGTIAVPGAPDAQAMEAYCSDFNAVSGDRADPALVRTLATNALDAV